ncbi:S-adenosyl-L-methionine-dependent methyltransferase [Xylogone sp. PMI_703]|nr:S-adenosyl-L-methionine-dependent methyltransferase [Xylogone sp. PMI_703]
MATEERTAKAARIAQYFLETRSDSESSKSLLAQMEHRLDLVEYWDIRPGARVLEIGCGQGDTTIVLADAVGAQGHVDAVDPGSPDYGAPFTLSQAQAFISASPVGSRITFHNLHPQDYLASYTGPAYDYIVLSHCIWYFESPSILGTIIAALAPHCKVLCIAEWSLRSHKVNGQAHVLTTLLLTALEAKRDVPSSGNVRTVLSPVQVRGIVEGQGVGLKIEKEVIRESNEGLLDGHWEVNDMLRTRDKVLGELRQRVCKGVNEKEVMVFSSMFDAVKANVDGLEGGVKGVKCMDHWVAKFVHAA